MKASRGLLRARRGPCRGADALVAAGEGRHLLLRQEADGTHRIRAELSREGAANLVRLLAAVEDVVDRNERADAQEWPDAVTVDR